MSSESSNADTVTAADAAPPRSFFRSDDWVAMVVAALCLAIAYAAIALPRPESAPALVKQHQELSAELKQLAPAAENYNEARKVIVEKQKKIEEDITPQLLKPYLYSAGTWKDNPLVALQKKDKYQWPAILVTFALLIVLSSMGMVLMKESVIRYIPAFIVVFLLAVVSFVLASQEVIKHYNLEYALWALFVGLIISNTVGLPNWLRPAVRTEFFIKTGLVLLGAEVLFNKLLALGIPGICVSWVVTPIVFVGTYLFGQHVLKMPSKSLNLVISADMSVCGVSAAIATGAACKAKKEEVSLAIGLSLAFTVVMMVVMPYVIRAMNMSEVLGGAWMGGTIDSTGAVAAAGKMLGDRALEVATTVKMIQNILIGVISFAVAVYWVSRVERNESNEKPSVYEIWRRFPKFALGFLLVSLICSVVDAQGVLGTTLVQGMVDGITKNLRGWFFCLAFVSIGLESDFRTFRKVMHGGKPLILYLCGQALNLILTLAMAYLMFEVVFRDAGAQLGK